HGKLTDHNGKSIDFRNVVVIMTTNAGASDLAKPVMGFSNKPREGEDTAAIERLFTPEFRNRLDAVVPFGPLPVEVIAKVVDKFVFQLEAQLADRGVSIELTDAAREWLCKRGYDEKFGARPLSRVIQENIKKPLADELLFGQLSEGGTVRVVVKERDGDDVLGFEYLNPPLPGEGRRAVKGKASPKKKTPVKALTADNKKALPGPDDEAPAEPKPRRRAAPKKTKKDD
ncbi:MAG: AAA family ATPase, partial [Planctomycetota bacterium]